MANRPSGPDLSASPREDCPCGCGQRVKVARKPDRDCQRCLVPGPDGELRPRKCAALSWVSAENSWLCGVCKQNAKLDRQTAGKLL